MLSTPERLSAISHPLIESLHMRKDFGTRPKPESVLVIKTSFPKTEGNYREFNSYLMDLLLDLDDVTAQAEDHIGKFDRVDICTN